MGDISVTVAVVLGLALVVAVVAFVLARGGRLQQFRLKLLKGLFDFGGTIDTKTQAGQLAADMHDGAYDEPPDLSHGIIRWLQEQEPRHVTGCYVLTESTEHNGKIAARLYSRVDGEIIGTCFFEGPHYGRGDFASNVASNSTFTRLASADVCDTETVSRAREVLRDFACKASLCIVPADVEISRIGGVFCHLSDRSYLAFLALNNAEDAASNRGLVFSGTLAQELFVYFKGFADRFREE